MVTTSIDCEKLVSRLCFGPQKMFSKIKEVVTLNKPAFVLMCILNLSKTLMYGFHYNCINAKKIVKPNCSSQTQEISCMKLKWVMCMKKFFADEDKCKFSEYSENSKFYDKINKKVIVKMKDRTKCVLIFEFVWLKSRMHLQLKENGEDWKKAKKIVKNVAMCLSHKKYKNILFE